MKPSQTIEQCKYISLLGFYLLLSPKTKRQYLCILGCCILAPILTKGIHYSFKVAVIFVLVCVSTLYVYKLIMRENSFLLRPPKEFLAVGICSITLVLIISAVGLLIGV